MKKNKLMRLASVLLVLTLLSTSVIGGTFAKYITSDSATDTARVAKFGVVATASGDLFGKSYKEVATTPTDGDNKAQAWDLNATSVSSTGTAGDATTAELLVAPGTKNDKGMTFTVKGTPEVSTKLNVDVPEGTTTGEGGNDNKDFVNTDIVLKKTGYSVMMAVTPSTVVLNADTMGNYYKLNGQDFAVLTADDFEADALKPAITKIYREVEMIKSSDMTENYYPLTWKVTDQAGTATENIKNVAAVRTAVVNALTGSGATTATKLPNETWNNSAKVTWEWAFGNAWQDATTDDTTLQNWENTTMTDLEDTILGDMIALAKGTETVGNRDYEIARRGSATGTLKVLNYATIPAAISSRNPANTVVVAYTDSGSGSAPSYFDIANDDIFACLTATFGARITVEQVD